MTNKDQATKAIERDGFLWVHDYYLTFAITQKDSGILGYYGGIFTFNGTLDKAGILESQKALMTEYEDNLDDVLLIGIYMLGIRKLVKSEEDK